MQLEETHVAFIFLIKNKLGGVKLKESEPEKMLICDDGSSLLDVSASERVIHNKFILGHCWSP
jgi:hypothetical protein